MPSRRELEALTTPLHQNAGALVVHLALRFATSLLVQAKTLAYVQEADLVLTGHIREAEERLRQTQRTWSRQLGVAVGGALFGSFVQGFLSEIGGQNRPALVITYVMMGFLGAAGLLWGLSRSR